MLFERRDLLAREFDRIAGVFDADERTDGAAGTRAEVTNRGVNDRASARGVLVGADPDRAADAGDQERAVTARRVVRTETRRLPGTDANGWQTTSDLRLCLQRGGTASRSASGFQRLHGLRNDLDT